jgi:DNA invertase Pin-like site-specific DNA recombinase
MKPVFYARVSRDDLHCENQKKILEEWYKRNSPDCEFIYIYEEISSRKTRPVKEAILKAFREGKYDTIVVTRIDRFARSLSELIMNVNEVVNNGGRFVAIMNSFDFQRNSFNATQQLMLNILGSFAEFEREIIRERTLEGLARARALGRIGGRPRGAGMPFPELSKVSECLGKGMEERDIANVLKTSRYKVRKAIEQIKKINSQLTGEVINNLSVG